MTDDTTGLDLDAKLEAFDENADAAVDFLIAWLSDHRSDLVALARGRHVWGHLRYGNRNFVEWSEPEMLVAIAEELADGIVYASKHVRDARARGEPPRHR